MEKGKDFDPQWGGTGYAAFGRRTRKHDNADAILAKLRELAMGTEDGWVDIGHKGLSELVGLSSTATTKAMENLIGRKLVEKSPGKGNRVRYRATNTASV